MQWCESNCKCHKEAKCLKPKYQPTSSRTDGWTKRQRKLKSRMHGTKNCDNVYLLLCVWIFSVFMSESTTLNAWIYISKEGHIQWSTARTHPLLRHVLFYAHNLQSHDRFCSYICIGIKAASQNKAIRHYFAMSPDMRFKCSMCCVNLES